MRTVFGVAVSLVGSLKVMSPASQRPARVVRTELASRCTILLVLAFARSRETRSTVGKMYDPLMSSMATSRADALLEELRRLTGRHARPDEETAIDGVLLSTAGRPGEPQASTTGTVMALIAQGAKRLAIGDRVYDYGPGQYLVASVDLPITGHYTHAAVDEPALGFGLILRPQRIATLLLETEDCVPSARSQAAPPGLGVAAATPELLDAVVRMVRLLDRPGDRAVLAPMIEREMLWLILNGPLEQPYVRSDCRTAACRGSVARCDGSASTTTASSAWTNWLARAG